jgi:hypothetical protein
MPAEDLQGREFGWLTVKERGPDNPPSRHAIWLCVCRCGKRVLVPSHRLKRDLHPQVSCGCQRANTNVRKAARLKVPAERRSEIAKMGGAAFAATIR